jgi:hypothetical protein
MFDLKKEASNAHPHHILASFLAVNATALLYRSPYGVLFVSFDSGPNALPMLVSAAIVLNSVLPVRPTTRPLNFFFLFL